MGLRDLPSALSITWLVLVLPTTCEFMFLSCFLFTCMGKTY
jgi:hypothetical protein